MGWIIINGAVMRIVFASLGSLGDLHPLLAMARNCEERGHGVVIAAGEAYAHYVKTMGFDFQAIRPDFNPDPEVIKRHYNRQGPENLLREEIFGRVRETYPDLLEATKGADILVVGELLYVAPMVAEKLGIPWVNVILAPTSFLSACDPCVLAPAPGLHWLRYFGTWPHRMIFAYGRHKTTEWSKPLQMFRRELGLRPGPNPVFEGKHSPHLVLAMFPRFLAAAQRDWPAATQQAGFPYFAQPGRPETEERVDTFLKRGKAPLIFTLGSGVVHIAKNFYQHAAKAAQELDCRAILLLGKNPAPANLPDTILAVDYAPLESLLPHAAAMIHQGGIGGCAEALRAGIPSLIIPFGFDQPDNAERMRKLGVARVLNRRRISKRTLVANLRILLSDSAMSARAKAFTHLIDPAADLAQAVEAIERVVLPGSPTSTIDEARAERIQSAAL